MQIERYDAVVQALSAGSGSKDDESDARMVDLKMLKGRIREDQHMAAEGLDEEAEGLARLIAAASSAAEAVANAKAALGAAALYATNELEIRLPFHEERRKQKRARRPRMLHFSLRAF